MAKKYVLTGGPCTGKTTTLNFLGKRGFQTLPEVPRIIIDHQLSINGNILPWKEFRSFQKEVLLKQIEFESKLQNASIAFLDRGIPDQLAYYRLHKVEPWDFLVETARKVRYDGVFLLDMLPTYETDSARKEDPETAKKIHSLINESYSDLGYDVVSVPPLSVEERIELILSNVKGAKKP